MSGGGGSSTQQTVTQKADPWAGAQPYLTQAYQQAGAQAGQPVPQLSGQQYFPYATTTAFAPDPKTLTGLQGKLAYASNYLPGLVDAGYQSHYDMLNAPNVAANPYINQMIGQMLGANTEALSQTAGDITDTLQQQWLPAIRSGAVGSGQYGGSRQGIAEGLALGQANENMSDYATNAARSLSQNIAGLQLGAYGQGLEQQRAAALMAPQVAQMGFMPSQAWQDVGTQLDAFRQAQINDAKARWDQGQSEAERVALQNYQLGWAPGQNLASIVGGTAAPYASSNRTSTGTEDAGGSTVSNLIGGGLLGSSLGSGLSTLISAAVPGAVETGMALAPLGIGLGPWGMALGALAGGLFG